MFCLCRREEEIEARSEEGVFVGYDRGSPAFLVYFPTESKIKRIRCVRFTEKKFVPEQEDCVLEDIRIDPERESREGGCY